jgi:hypothetical protein
VHFLWGDVASSLVTVLAEMGRLGSHFFFKRGDVALGDPASFWRTTSYDLSRRDPFIANRVIQNIEQGKVDPGRPEIESHFKYLIQEPLTEYWQKHNEQLRFRGADKISKADQKEFSERWPARFPVIVLDAMDECGCDRSQQGQRRIFMNTITNWSRLDPSFKLLITSRDDRIPQSFRDVCHHVALEAGDLASFQARADIQVFFERRFADIASPYPSLPPLWPGQPIIKQLTDYAAGLFIWAETVMRFLEQGFPEEQLDLVLAGTFRDSEEGNVVDELYRQILRLSFNNSTDHILATFRRVVGAIALAKTPLHRIDLQHFLGRPDRESSIDFILNKLSSVISDGGGRLRIGHLSFTEFICDPKRCDHSFVIDSIHHNRTMTLACLRLMKAGLRFNICELETSHLRNKDIPDLATRINTFLPTRLFYACQFWVDHLQATVFDVEILDGVKEFLYFRFLYWLEVLSLIEMMRIASPALLVINGWCKVSSYIFPIVLSIINMQCPRAIKISRNFRQMPQSLWLPSGV